MASDNLSDAAIRKAAPGPKPVRMFDGRGLYLEVSPKGGKWWRLKYRFDGKEKLLSLGTYPEVSLKKARDKREEARTLVAAGVDPSTARKAARASSRTGGSAGSFEVVARELHGTRRGQWSEPHARRWIERLEKDVFPFLGSRALPDINAPLLLETLRRVEARGVRETVHSILQGCGQVFRYGIATGRGERNPASDLRGALKPVLVKNMAAVTDPVAAGALLRAMDDYQGSPLTRGALQLSALLFQRPGNVRAMRWAALKLDGAEPMWSIPAAEMKRSRYEKLNGRPHLVPLPRQAVAILKELSPISGHGDYVFPSLLAETRPLRTYP